MDEKLWLILKYRSRDQKYKIILEDSQGSLSFFDLPIKHYVAAGISIQERTNDYLIRVSGAPPANTEIIMTEGQNLLLSEDATRGTSHVVRKADLKTGFYKILLLQNQMELNAKLIFHRSLNHEIIKSEQSKNFSTRTSITWELPNELAGSFSVSVRKTDAKSPTYSSTEFENYRNVKKPIMLEHWSEVKNAVSFSEWRFPKGKPLLDQVEKLPEYKGHFVDGKITPKKENVLVSLSIPGEGLQVRNDRTNEAGNFSIDMEDLPQSAYEIHVSTTDPNTSVEIESPFLNQYPALDFSPVLLDSIRIKDLKERSVHIQVENAYHEIKTDSVVSMIKNSPQFIAWDYNYLLED